MACEQQSAVESVELLQAQLKQLELERHHIEEFQASWGVEKSHLLVQVSNAREGEARAQQQLRRLELQAMKESQDGSSIVLMQKHVEVQQLQQQLQRAQESELAAKSAVQYLQVRRRSIPVQLAE
jgi:hypothetical protein